MRMTFVIAVMVAAVGAGVQAQWTLQESGTTASLRGIHSLGGGVAWASGSGGTVLRTVDGGAHWLHCAVPDADKDGAKLDFRGVQAFDAETAIVMSSGTGALSRLYKTVDGCSTWTLLFTNPEKDGFWDAVSANSPEDATVLGDAGKRMAQFCRWSGNGFTLCGGRTAQNDKESSFAASNSVLQIADSQEIDSSWKSYRWWTSEDENQMYFHVDRHKQSQKSVDGQGILKIWTKSKASNSSGIFSLRFRDDLLGVWVGGDYQLPDGTEGMKDFTGYTLDGGVTFLPAETFPNGYRSSVDYAESPSTWITVGPNGTDVSTDDGRNWHPLKPGPGDAADADKGWNALGLPFVVGSKGRIGVLRDGTLGTK